MRSGGSYPDQQPAPYPGGPAPHPNGPGAGPRSPRRGRGRRSWPSWAVVPFLSGALAVLAVFALLQFTVLSHRSGSARPAAASSAATPQGPMPAQVFPDALFKQLTKDLQGNDEKGFLSLVAPAAQPAVRTWWENLEAIGFTTGLVMPTNKSDQVNLDRAGNGTTVALAGAASALDVRDSKGHPAVPLERYQLSLHFASAKAIGQITAWKPLGAAPWDQGKLYVAKGGNVVVAGPAAESAVVDETLPIAESAATYDTGVINHVHPSDLHQLGFVVFVSGDATVRNRWFSTTKQPAGWPPAGSGLTAQLPGPAASDDTSWNLSGLADDSTGGARVVITPFEDQAGGSAQLERAELVDHFAVDILAASDQELIPGSAAATAPAWAVEGFGVAFEAAYDSDSNPTPDQYSFAALNSSIKQLRTSYKTGQVPTSGQLFNGTDQSEQDWRAVAASVYATIATKYGFSQLLASAELMWTAGNDPRQNVLESATSQSYTFYDKATIQNEWEAYLAAPVDAAPATGPHGV